MRGSRPVLAPLLVLWVSACLAQRPLAAELGDPMRLEEATSGELLLATQIEGAYLPAPTLETEVTLRVAGLVSRTEVRQRFFNPTSQWVEGIYVFPLPDTAAVDSLRLVIGERVIEGQIDEREVAEQRYQAARQNGQRASLVGQERPNLFTTAIANLGPEETVEIVIEYQQEVRYDAGVFSLRFPMVVAPRYRPRSQPHLPEAVPTPTPPRLPAAALRSNLDGAERSNPVRLTAWIDAGVPLARVESATHEVLVSVDEDGLYRVDLAAGPVSADRDFVLSWEPEVGRAPVASLFLEDRGGETYALLMVLPPIEAAAPRLTRTVIFVIDTSASMAGASIRQARRALAWAIDRLEPEDRFNVIRFSSYAERLFPSALPADEETRRNAIAYVRALTPRGGTEMLTALSAALDRPDAREGLTQVVFITDGEVDNEDELFEFIQHRLGTSRLFTVGIGSAPNAHFMRKAAQHGRGTFTFIGRPSEIEERMALLFAKLESPVLSDLSVEWLPGAPTPAGVETWPRRIGDLYLGEPLMVAARLPRSRGEFTVDARFDDRAFRVTARGGARSSGIAALWARRKIASLLDQAPGSIDEKTRQEVVEVALEHGLVSRFTSLVAVDTYAQLRDGPVPEPRLLPVHLPAGWVAPLGSAAPGSGVLPRGGTAGPLHLAVGLLALGLAGLLLARLLSARARRLSTGPAAQGGRR